MFRSIIFCAIIAVVFGASLPSLERVAGGENAGIESAPSTVSVQYLQEHVCNGVLITRRHVLTAASCVQEVLPDNVQVRVGSSRHDRGGALKNVHNIMIHPNFSQPIPNNNNIAVIHLRQPVPEGSLARPIAIASPESQLADNAAVQLAGWQLSNNEENEYSEQLQIAQLNTVARAQCATAHGNVAQGDQAVSRISDTMICATNPRLGGNSACTSGSPLSVRNEHTQVLIALASWSRGCGNGTLPGVYTHVTPYLEWIRSCNCPV